jgi:hypothetical protein
MSALSTCSESDGCEAESAWFARVSCAGVAVAVAVAGVAAAAVAPAGVLVVACCIGTRALDTAHQCIVAARAILRGRKRTRNKREMRISLNIH